MDLRTCAETLIGTDFIRGVFGGEKKRTSIGMELVLSPRFSSSMSRPPVSIVADSSRRAYVPSPLDAGLDASTAQTVMNRLHRLA